MKLSPAQIVVVSLFLAAGVLLAVFALSGGGGAEDPDAFLQEVRQRAQSAADTEDIVAPLVGTASSQAVVPKVRIEPEAPVFGPIPNTGIFNAEVMVHNDGPAPLVIGKISTECPCTQGQMLQTTIPPGGSAPLGIRIDPDIILGFQTTKTLTIMTNDPKRRALDLPVTSIVDPEFSVRPEKIDFGVVTKGETPTQRLHFVQINDEPFEIRGVGTAEGQTQDFAASYLRVPENEWTTPGKAEYFVDVTLGSDAPVGAYAREVAVLTSTRRLKEFRFAAVADVQAFYRIEPVALVYDGRGKVGEKGTLDLTVQGNAPIEVVDVRSDHKWLTFTPVPGGSPNSVIFDVSISPESETGILAGNLTFRVRGDGKEYTETRAFSFAVTL